MNIHSPQKPRFVLRDYQQEAVDSVFKCFDEGLRSMIVVVPTGGGKTLIIGDICRRFHKENPTKRIVSTSHVMELVEQGYGTFRKMCPDIHAGVYSASLGRKDAWADVTFASVQSIARVAGKFRSTGLLLVDEAHLIPHTSDGQYRSLIRDLQSYNPDLIIIGLTATPYRLNSGNLLEPYRGDPPLFQELAYEIKISRLLSEKYLSPLTAYAPQNRMDVKAAKIGTRMGEYKEDDLNKAFNTDATNLAMMTEFAAAMREHDRKSGLVFGISVDHCERLASMLRAQGISAQTISAKTPKAMRRSLIDKFKRGEVRVLTNVNVLSTGFDHPGVDILALARPTASPGLYLQQAGRGLRIADGKADCIVLDFAGNVARHGLIDGVRGIHKDGKKKEADGPSVKECEACGALNDKEAIACVACDVTFPKPPPPPQVDREGKLFGSNTAQKVMASIDECVWKPVIDVGFWRHEKPGKPTSLKVSYRVPGEPWPVDEWICFEHDGYALNKAKQWWRRRSRGGPPPQSVAEALGRLSELKRPSEIFAKRDGRYWTVEDVKFVLDHLY